MFRACFQLGFRLSWQKDWGTLNASQTFRYRLGKSQAALNPESLLKMGSKGRLDGHVLKDFQPVQIRLWCA
jgi:hypothetical protein